MISRMAQRFGRGGDRQFLISMAACMALYAAAVCECNAGDPFIFYVQQTIDVSNSPRDLALGDLDGNLKPDVILAAENESNGFYVLMAGPGGLSAPAFHLVDSGAAPNHVGKSVLLADFDNDGFLDAAFGRDVVGVTISPGNGDGTFGQAVTVLTGVDVLDYFFWPMRLNVIDLENDNDLDLVVGNGRTGLLYILRNDGDLSFTLTQTFELFGTTQYAVGDLNADGADDLVWAYEDGMQVGMNDGQGSILPPVFIFIDPLENKSGAGIWDLAVVDIDIDGDNDIVGTVPYAPVGFLAVVLNDGAGGVEDILYPEIPIVASIDMGTADFDGDLRIDLAVLDATGTLFLFRNTTETPGEFQFELAQGVAVGTVTTDRMAIASMDGDCDFDVVTVSKGAGKLRVVDNISPQLSQCAFADFNFSGSIDADDLAFLLGEWGKLVSPADLNLSGLVDAWDLAIFLWAWLQPVPSP